MINEKFLRCVDYTFDEWWINIYTKCSKGKFPKNVSYNSTKNELIILSKGKEKKYVLPEIVDDNYGEFFNKTLEIFKKDLDMRSPKDKHVKQKKVLKQIKCWKDVKNKNKKEELIDNFVLKLQKEHGFDNSIREKILHEIKFNITMSRINQKNIVIKDEEIKNINNITLKLDKPENNYLKIKYSKVIISSQKTNLVKKKPWKECEKYLKQVCKKTH